MTARVSGPRVLAVTTAVIVVSLVADAVGWWRIAAVVSPALVVAALVAARLEARRRRGGRRRSVEGSALPVALRRAVRAARGVSGDVKAKGQVG